MPKPTDCEAAIKAGRLQPGMTFNQRVWALTSRIPPSGIFHLSRAGPAG